MTDPDSLADPEARARRILENHRAGADVREALDQEIEAWHQAHRPAYSPEHDAILAALAGNVPLDAAIAAALPQPPRARALRTVEGERPLPLIWRAEAGAALEGSAVDPVLLPGSVTMLGGVGGIGKSTVTLTLAIAAAQALGTNNAYGEACGLRVTGGGVLMVGYEDDLAIVRERATRIGKAAKLAGWQKTDALQVLELSTPLFAPSDRGGRGRPQPTRAWEDVWTSVRRTAARLLVIDPLTAAFAGDVNADTAGARALLEATRQAARTTGCGVLFVCHAAKSERTASTERQAAGRLDAAEIDPAAIAGSAAFYDGARCVLYLERAPTKSQIAAAPKPRTGGPVKIDYAARLVCLKSNYGRAGWWLPLAETKHEGEWAGFVPAAPPAEGKQGW